MKKGILGLVLMLMMVSASGCGSSEVENSSTTQIKENNTLNMNVTDDIQIDTVVENEPETEPIVETEPIGEATYDGSVTFYIVSEEEYPKSYTIYFDQSRLNYLGNASEFYEDSSGELFGRSPYDISTLISGNYLNEEETAIWTENMIEEKWKPVFEEMRGDGVMNVYEYVSSVTGETFWEVKYYLPYDGSDCVLFTGFTEATLETYGMQDIYDMVSCFGELKANN